MNLFNIDFAELFITRQKWFPVQIDVIEKQNFLLGGVENICGTGENADHLFAVGLSFLQFTEHRPIPVMYFNEDIYTLNLLITRRQNSGLVQIEIINN